jgi:hypothetical protein
MSDAQIGSLLILLEANTAKLDEQIKASRQNFTDLKSSVTDVGNALAAIGVYEGIKAVIDATTDAQKAQALLASQIMATGDASGYTQQQLEDMAGAFSQSSTSSKEQIEGLEAELMAFRNVAGTQFQGAIQAALNFSAVTGRDATQAIKTLGMALNDPVTGMGRLKQAGIDLTDSIKETIKQMAQQGDLVGAQNALLDQMAKSYGGAAAAARDTLGGALEGLKNDFHELLAGDGTGVAGLTQSITDLDHSLNDPAVKTGIDVLVAGMIKLVDWGAQLAEKFTEIGQGLAVIFAGGQGDAIQDIGNKLGAAQQQLKTYQDQLAYVQSGHTDTNWDADELNKQIATQLALVQQLQAAWDTLIRGHDSQAPGPKTYSGMDTDTVMNPNLDNFTPIKTLDSRDPGNYGGLKSGYDQMVEDQKKVLQIWKENDPHAYLQQEIADTQALIGTLVNGQLFTSEDAETRIQQLQEAWKRHNDAMTEATQSAAQSMQGDLEQFFFNPFQEGLDGLLKAFINTIQEMLAKWAAMELFNAAFGSMDASGNGSGTAGFGDLMSGLFGGHRAGGGPAMAGMLYQVNEGGPNTEGFLPSTGGQIIPLGSGQGQNSGPSINVGYNVHVGSGADGGAAAQMLQFAPMFRRQIQSDIQYWLRRGAWPV